MLKKLMIVLVLTLVFPLVSFAGKWDMPTPYPDKSLDTPGVIWGLILGAILESFLSAGGSKEVKAVEIDPMRNVPERPVASISSLSPSASSISLRARGRRL